MPYALPPYKPASRHARGGYVVRSTIYPVGAIRPNRTAAGMAYTNSRRGMVPSKPETLRLSIRGTLDSLPAIGFCILRRPGQPFRLNEAGQRRLRMLRERRAARTA